MAYQPMYNAYAGVPYGYPGYYPQTTAPMGQSTAYQQPINGLVSVTGIEGAKAYQLPPNSSMPLFDQNNDILYLKTTDSAGYPTIRSFSFKAVEQADQKSQAADYVTRSEFDALVHDVKVLVGKMESASEPKGADHGE